MFHPGTHGNYLTFVLNQCLLGDKFLVDNPFSQLGTSHAKIWDIDWNLFQNQIHFRGYHQDKISLLQKNEKFIKIDFDTTDNLIVMQLVLKRGGDGNIDVDDMCKDTYHKLINHVDLRVRAIIDHINQYIDISPYYNIKDHNWPDINTVSDFFCLPQQIIDECKNIFDFVPVDLSAERPDAPRWVLRNIFKSWFTDKNYDPALEMKLLDQFPEVYKFNLHSFYDFDAMNLELKKISSFFDLKLNLNNFSKSLHNEFVSRVPFRDTLRICNNLLAAIINQTNAKIDLNVFCEGYLDFLVEKQFGITLPLHREKYFSSTQEIVYYINQYR